MKPPIRAKAAPRRADRRGRRGRLPRSAGVRRSPTPALVTARRVSSFDATLSGNSVIVATSGAGIVGPLGGCPRDLWGEMQGDKTINLRASDRFVSTAVLRGAYLRYEGSRNPSAPDHVLLEDGLELGIVASAVPEIARGISSMLSCSLEDAKTDRGGHLPAAVVERVQSEIISPYGVANLWGTTGHRFVLSRRVDAVTSELLATILVGRRKGTIFFFTGRYNNLRHSQIARDVDFAQPAGDDPAQRWFDQFAFPDLIRFKPTAYHQIANFVVAGSTAARAWPSACSPRSSPNTRRTTSRPAARPSSTRNICCAGGACGRSAIRRGSRGWRSSASTCAGGPRASSSSTTGRRCRRSFDARAKDHQPRVQPFLRAAAAVRGGADPRRVDRAPARPRPRGDPARAGPAGQAAILPDDVRFR
jgi:hypothetical protein